MKSSDCDTVVSVEMFVCVHFFGTGSTTMQHNESKVTVKWGDEVNYERGALNKHPVFA